MISILAMPARWVSRHCFSLNLPRALQLDTEPTMISTSPPIRFVFTIQKDRWQIYFFLPFLVHSKILLWGQNMARNSKTDSQCRSIIAEFLNWVFIKIKVPALPMLLLPSGGPLVQKNLIFLPALCPIPTMKCTMEVLIQPFWFALPVSFESMCLWHCQITSRGMNNSHTFCTPRWHSMGKLP